MAAQPVTLSRLVALEGYLSSVSDPRQGNDAEYAEDVPASLVAARIQYLEACKNLNREWLKATGAELFEGLL